MALWKDPTKDPSMPGSDGAAALAAEPAMRAVATPAPASSSSAGEPARRAERAAPAAVGSAKESLIAADVTIEGKIEGAGHVRIAGRFKGDVNVQGNVTIEQGAHVTGQIAAATVMVSGEVHGNIQASSRVARVHLRQMKWGPESPRHAWLVRRPARLPHRNRASMDL